MTTCDAPTRNKGSEYKNLSISLLVVSSLFVLQRFGFKIYKGTELGIDDWLTLVALLHLLSITITNTELVRNGLGRDVWTLRPETINNFGKYFFINVVLYMSEVAVLKLAILFFYLRIFPDERVRLTVWATIVLDSVYGVAFVFASCLQCRPASHYWTSWSQETSGSCSNTNALAWANAGISIALDVWMLFIPLFEINKVRLSRGKKIAVSLMFCMGSFFTIVSILRLRSLLQYRSDSKNPTWEFLEAARWSVIETSVGIMCACMPSLRLLLARMSPKLFGSTAQPRNSGPASRTRPTHGNDIPLETNIKADTDSRRGLAPKEGISYERTFTVESTDNDEVGLV
ncbi:hypothetical protein FDECE_14107 [Fusarium decemcellulare]|nr:hypothetical protein FDECE_14107 [Fusarium decemcellulare]